MQNKIFQTIMIVALGSHLTSFAANAASAQQCTVGDQAQIGMNNGTVVFGCLNGLTGKRRGDPVTCAKPVAGTPSAWTKKSATLSYCTSSLLNGNCAVTCN